MTTEDAIRARVRSARKSPPKQWAPVQVDALTQGVEVLAFDQTLSNTGYVRLVVTETGWVDVLTRGTVMLSDRGLKGHAWSLDRAERLYRNLRDSRPLHSPEVVYEAPAIHGYRVESALLAALTVRLVYPQASSVQRQHAISLFLPKDKRDKKKYTTEVVERFTGKTERWNEHERDAFLLALAYLHDRERP